MGASRVVVSHAGIQYSYQLALALQEIGVLERFYTTFCYSENHWSGRVLRALPNRYFKRALPYLKRRKPAGLSTELVYPYLWPELFRRGASYLFGRNYFTTNRLLHWQNRAFDLYVSSHLHRISFDVLIALSGGALCSLRRAKRLGKVAVLDQHDIHYRLAERLLGEERERCPEFADTIPYWPPLTSYLRCLEEEMRVADYILVPSTFALRSHLEAGVPGEKLILVPHATEPRYESVSWRRQPDGKFRVLFVGSITQRKGIKYLLEAVKQLEVPGLELIMIGDVVQSAEALKSYGDHLRWVGYVAHDALKTYFDMSDVLVLPSIYDAFGLVALEAMAAGLPVIVSEHTAAGSDVVRDGIDGFVVPIRDVDALRDRLMWFWRDERLRIGMGHNGRERVKQFNWESYKNRLVEVVERIAGGPRG